MAFHEEDLVILIAEKNANENHNRKRKVLLSGWIDLCIRSLNIQAHLVVIPTYYLVWCVLSDCHGELGSECDQNQDRIVQVKNRLLGAAIVCCTMRYSSRPRTSHGTESRHCRAL